MCVNAVCLLVKWMLLSPQRRHRVYFWNDGKQLISTNLHGSLKNGGEERITRVPRVAPSLALGVEPNIILWSRRDHRSPSTIIKSPIRGSFNGGEERIRTSGTVARTTVFETAAFDHSATSPHISATPYRVTEFYRIKCRRTLPAFEQFATAALRDSAFIPCIGRR